MISDKLETEAVDLKNSWPTLNTNHNRNQYKTVESNARMT